MVNAGDFVMYDYGSKSENQQKYHQVNNHYDCMYIIIHTCTCKYMYMYLHALVQSLLCVCVLVDVQVWAAVVLVLLFPVV